MATTPGTPKRDALDAIHAESQRLLNVLGSSEGASREEELKEGLRLIMSIARYRYDVRSEEEKERTAKALRE